MEGNLRKSGLILLGIGIVIFLMGLSVHDKRLINMENGNAIVGGPFRHYWPYIGLPRILLEVQHHECRELKGLLTICLRNSFLIIYCGFINNRDSSRYSNLRMGFPSLSFLLVIITLRIIVGTRNMKF